MTLVAPNSPRSAAPVSTTRTEWGVRYEVPLTLPDGTVIEETVTRALPGKAFAAAAVSTRTPIHAHGHRMVSRVILTDWAEG